MACIDTTKMKFCDDTQLYYAWNVRGKILNVDKRGDDGYFIWTEEEFLKEFYDEDEAQEYYNKMIEEGEDDYDAYELEKQWYEHPDDEDPADVETFESDLCAHAKSFAKNLWNYGVDEETGEPLTDIEFLARFPPL